MCAFIQSNVTVSFEVNLISKSKVNISSIVYFDICDINYFSKRTVLINPTEAELSIASRGPYCLLCSMVY